MKIKNLILGLAAFAIAIGSAYASLTVASNIFVKVYATQQDFINGIITCHNTQKACQDIASGIRCQVSVPTTVSGAVITNKTYKTTCTAPIWEGTATLPVSTITVYALAE